MQINLPPYWKQGSFMGDIGLFYGRPLRAADELMALLRVI